MKTYAINICLIPDNKTYKLSKKLNKFDKGNYNKNDSDYIPHATLVMKTVDDNDLKYLINNFEKLSLGKYKTKNNGYYFIESYGGRSGFYPEKTKELKNLQENILQITEKIENKGRTRKSYIVQDFFDKNLEKEEKNEDYFRKKDLHITFGKNDIKQEFEKINFPEIITFEKLVIGQMGNYGSVRKVLFEKRLK